MERRKLERKWLSFLFSIFGIMFVGIMVQNVILAAASSEELANAYYSINCGVQLLLAVFTYWFWFYGKK